MRGFVRVGNLYCTRSDVYTYGLPRGTLGMPGRLVAASLAATDVLELEGHGFETGDEIVFRASEGGTLSAPLVSGTSYYAIRLNDSTFKTSTTPTGGPIDLTTDGVSMVVGTPLPFDKVIEFYSRFADGFLPSHAVPLLAPYPLVVVAIVAELSAKKLQHLAGHTSIAVNEYEVAAQKQLERYALGIPVRDPNQTPTNKAAFSSLVVSGTDSRGWGSRYLP